MQRFFPVVLFLLLLLNAAPTSAAPADETAKPNFIFFLVDDLGWSDISCFGSKFNETPNIDALAKRGMRFTDAYTAASICSPTRASIVTGKHPVRVNITDWIPGRKPSKSAPLLAPEDQHHLGLEEVTIADALRAGGYGTFFAGKWHLGETEKYWPEHRGFDINIGGWSVGSPRGGYYAPYTNPRLKAKEKGEYLTERLTDETINYLKKNAGSKKPFLVYLAYYNVHTPIQPYKKKVEHFKEKKAKLYGKSSTPSKKERTNSTRMRQDNAELASMVAAVDVSVGRVLATLKELKLDDNTVVVFFSDNGGLSTLTGNRVGPTSNLPLRAGKGWLYEGGIRVPMIISVPGMTKPGSVCDEPVLSTDFYPTFLELAGMPAQPKQHCDGVSLVPLLDGSKKADEFDRGVLCWHYPHYHGSGWEPGAAIRSGDWKLIEIYHADKNEIELYNLKEDIGEKKDLAKLEPKKCKELLEALHKWQKELGAKLPVPQKK